MTFYKADRMQSPRYRVQVHDEMTAAVAVFLRERGLDARVDIEPRALGGRVSVVRVGSLRLAVRVAMQQRVARYVTVNNHRYGPYVQQFWAFNLHVHGKHRPPPAFWVLVPDAQVAHAFIVPGGLTQRLTVSIYAGHMEARKRSPLWGYQGAWAQIDSAAQRAAA